MANPDPAFVVAVAGMSGAGKTTLVRNLASRLPGAKAMYFDDYSSVSTYPADLGLWIDGGADPAEWRTPQLAADLASLRAGRSITLPANKGSFEPAPYIILEEPFGRQRPDMAGLIDLVIAIDTPADIALARRAIRDMKAFFRDKSKDELESYLTQHLGWHINLGRRLYSSVNEPVLTNCDLRLDGSLSADEMADIAVQAVLAAGRPRTV